jgi:hypothetical protein
LSARAIASSVAEFIQNDEVHAGLVIGQAALTGVASLDLETIDEIDDVVKAATSAPSDAASGDRDGQVGLACAGTADQDSITRWDRKAPLASLVDRRALELEVVEILGKRQFGDGEQVLDRAGLLLANLAVRTHQGQKLEPLRWIELERAQRAHGLGTKSSANLK